MKNNKENLRTKIIDTSVEKGGYFKPHIALLSSCPCWIFLIASGLWLVQPSPLKAMENEEISKKSIKTQVSPNNFYEDSDHPLTQGFWKESDLSYKLKSIGWNLNKTKKEIIKYKINSIIIDNNDLYDYKKILQCFLSDPEPVQGLSDIKFKDLIISADDQNNRNNGFSGAIVSGPLECNNTEVIIKKFLREEEGLKELLCSLIALSMNPSPSELKMARIYDAAFCSNNSQNCLSIVMECAPGHDIHHFLATNHAKNSVKACAEYLSTFHIKNHRTLSEKINKEKFIEYAAYFSNTLSNDLIEEQTGPALFSLIAERQQTDLENIRSDDIIKLLSKQDQEKFILYLKIIHKYFKKNSSEIFNLIGSENLKNLTYYFLTILHGDAHGRNFFYTPSVDLVSQNGEKIQTDSHLRITMIDFASIIETYGEIGDPAADIGRFLGSLWDWAAQKSYEKVDGYEEICSDEKISALQIHFFDTYLKKIKESDIFREENPKNLEIFEKILKENSNFYKIRYYRAIFNSDKHRKSDNVKVKILKSWMKENAALVPLVQKNTPITDFITEETNLRHWNAVAGGTLHCYLPEPVQGFITSAAEGSRTSYLTQLWKTLQNTGTATLSSGATIAGMGGIGKTTLALAYAHEALSNNAYNLIYWLPSGTELSLLKGYRNLLLEIGMTTDNGIPIRNVDPQRIIELVKQHVPKMGRSLLIYDNVSGSGFLEDMIPQENTDIVITSRCNEGWECSLPLEVFRVKDSVKYLCKITGLQETDENEKIAEELAEALGHFPLALAHAAHYIKLVGGEGISALHFNEYLEGFLEKPKKQLDDKRNPLEDPQPKITYENLIARTLRMSEEYLKKNGILQLSKEVLAYCSYLDADSISEEIFLDYWPNQKESKKNIEKALEKLAALSLITKIQKKASFSIHQLVQLVLRDETELNSNEDSQKPLFQMVAAFNKLFKENIGTDEQIEKLLSCSTHFTQLLEHSRRLEGSVQERDSEAKSLQLYDYHCPEVTQLEWMGKVLYIMELYDAALLDFNIMCCKDPILQVQRNIPEKLLKKLRVFYTQLLIDKDLPDWLGQVAEHSHPKLQTALARIYNVGDFVIKNTKKGFDWCCKAAEQQDTDAQFTLACLYFEGIGIEKDYEEAAQYVTKAALKGHILSLFILGFMYEIGKGVPKDDKEAARYYKMAADRGNTSAQLALGAAYLNGRGVDQNYDAAIRYYKMAAMQGAPAAQLNLGLMYEHGRGVPQNYKEAAKYYKMAADQGNALAQLYLGKLCAKGQGVTQSRDEATRYYKMADDQEDSGAQFIHGLMFENGEGETQNHEEAARYYTMAVNQGHLEAQFNLGLLYENGHGVDQNYGEAAKYYRMAADHGYSKAQFNLGLLYENGHGVDQNYGEAIRYYKMAAEQGHSGAQINLGLMYAEGRGVDQNYDEAIRYYKMAAVQGTPAAQFNLGLMYANGKGVLQSYKEAAKYYTLAADQGAAPAQFNLGCMYNKGHGVEQNDNKAVYYFELAAAQGHSGAQLNLELLSNLVECKKMLCLQGGAIEQLNIAATQGNPLAALSLWSLYGSEGAFKNDQEAFKWCAIAADQGNAQAQFALAEMYLDGLGTIQNYSEALRYYFLAAQQGHGGAVAALEMMSQLGIGILQDDEKVIEVHKNDDDMELVQDQFTLGLMYTNGQGVERDDFEALKWFIKAAEQGYTPAQDILEFVGYGVQ